MGDLLHFKNKGVNQRRNLIIDQLVILSKKLQHLKNKESKMLKTVRLSKWFKVRNDIRATQREINKLKQQLEG